METAGRRKYFEIGNLHLAAFRISNLLQNPCGKPLILNRAMGGEGYPLKAGIGVARYSLLTIPYSLFPNHCIFNTTRNRALPDIIR